MAESPVSAASNKGKRSFLFLINGRRQASEIKAKAYQSPEIDFDTLPIIDKVPTAIGYQSSGSEGTLDEKSRSNRYIVCDAEEDDRDDYDYISETDDRYSIYSTSVNSSSKDDESIADFEVKIGHELHRQREHLRDRLVRLAKSADQAETADDPNLLPRLNIHFGETNTKATTWSSPGSCNGDES